MDPLPAVTGPPPPFTFQIENVGLMEDALLNWLSEPCGENPSQRPVEPCHEIICIHEVLGEPVDTRRLQIASSDDDLQR